MSKNQDRVGETQKRKLLNSVGSRLLVIILAITITGMGLIAIIGNILAGNVVIEQTLSRVAEITSHDADHIDGWFVNQSRYLEAIATDISMLADTDPETVFPVLVKHTGLNEEYYAIYMGYPDGTAVFSDRWIPDYNEWVATERDWYKDAIANPGEVFVSDLYKDASTGELCLTFSKAIVRNNAVIGVLAADIMISVLIDLVASTDVGKDSYANLTDDEGNIILNSSGLGTPVIDAHGDIKFYNIAEIEGGLYSDLRSDAVLNGEFIKVRGYDGITRYYVAYPVETTGWILYTAIPVNIVEAPVRNYQIAAVVVLIVVACVAALLIYFSLRNMIVRPVKDVTKAANLLARGEKVSSLDGKYIGEIALLAESFRGMENFNDQQSEWLRSIAGGDLSIEVSPRGDDDYIGQSIKSMLDGFHDMFISIGKSTHKVTTGSKQIANGAQILADGAMQQAAAVEQLSSIMSELSDKTKRNAEIANESANLSTTMRENAEQGSLQMDQLIQAVRDITEASNSIGNVISTIDDLAFQTQILALNAAVEAARAGHHGKGFTVVADEVRNLAVKSAEAAQNTSELIENSVTKANMGLEIANKTATQLNLIVDGINHSATIAGQIAKSSADQTEDIAQINASIDLVMEVVQQNSATAEQSAASSSDMSAQAEKLELQISNFHLRNE